jgi:DNA polymerase-3 subunit delta
MKVKHYLLIGTSYDPLILRAHALIESICEKEDVVTFDLSEQDFSDVYEDIITPPLFSDKKVVLIKNFDLVIQEEAYELKMREYFKKPNEDVYIVCLSAHKQGLKSWLKLIDLHMEIIEVDAYNEIEVQKLIQKEVTSHGMTIDKDAFNTLILRLMLQKETLHVNLLKLITYTLDTKRITLKDVLTMIELPLEDNVFEMIQAFINKNIQSTLKIYHDLLFINEDPVRILSLIGRKLGQLEDTLALISSGHDQRQVSTALHISNGQAYYMVKEAKSIKKKDLEQWIDQLSDVDFKIKSGQIDKKIAVELFLIGEYHV